ncbi:MAG TPA: phage holin family protein [Candidatus Binataceae bacterium]|nr:phage holin family protein [Candidatus Binataceae bacterium]
MSAARPVSEVLTDIVRNLQEIIHGEIQLARTEIREQLHSTRPAGVLIGVGVAGGLLGAFFLLLFVVEALSLVIPSWVASLAVGIVVALLAAVTFGVGMRRLRPAAQMQGKTVSNMKEKVACSEPQRR